MNKVFLLIMIVTGLCFAGNFEKSSDTTGHKPVYHQTVYDYTYVEEDLVEPTPTVVIWKRTAPDRCINVNCKENQKYYRESKHKKKHKRHVKVIRKE